MAGFSADRLQERIGQFKYLFDKNIDKLQTITCQLLKTAKDFREVHHKNTIGSLSGSVIGAAGGITSIAGLLLAPFTLGTSLIVAGVGLGLGVVGAVSNIKSTKDRSEVKDSIEKLLAEFNTLMEPIEENLELIQDDLDFLKKCKESSSTDNILKFLRSGSSGACWLLNGVEDVAFLANVVKLSKMSTISIQSIRSALHFSVVLTGLLAVVDIAFIWADARELHEMSREQRRHAKTETLQFIKSIEDTASRCQKAVNELKEMKLAFDT
ncbi:apolipoprotein L3-like [Osmerus mordax]|uniref:apolipoprotein L3-like n=1 Tax=Osmerus mordax TaxID=8014 RepID=UPI00350EC533